MFQERYANGIYRDCKFCNGKGCLACPAERDKEYNRQFPDGLRPMATFRLDYPTDAVKAKELISAQALTSHFGEGGRGVAGIIEALRQAGKLEE